MNVYAFAPVSVSDLISGKNTLMQATENNPVLIIGTEIEASSTAIKKFLFFSSLNIRPASNPAIPVFKTHTSIVQNGEKLKNNAWVDGAVITTIPLTTPSINPAVGPKIILPITIGISASVILTGPKVM